MHPISAVVRVRWNAFRVAVRRKGTDMGKRYDKRDHEKQPAGAARFHPP
jgi:hypothetical protein